MKKTCTSLFVTLILFVACARGEVITSGADTNDVKILNKSGYDNRFTNAEVTVQYANKALVLAKKIGFNNGIAEAYRVKGIGEFYQAKSDSAINDYLDAVKYFDIAKNESGKARVFNNIGNLYQSIDYERALDYFGQAMVIGEKKHDSQLIASLNLNIGNVYFRKNSFSQALKYCTLAREQFTALSSNPGNKIFLVQCLQDLGAIYFHLNQTEKAEEYLLEANKDAKEKDMNSSIASMNLELAEIYIKKENYSEAERFLQEGTAMVQLIKSDKLANEYKFEYYRLESARKNYKAAVNDLFELYKHDSLTYNADNKTRIKLAISEQEHQKDAEIAQKDKENASQRFWLLAVTAGLLLVVIGLLTSNVKRKANTNSQLTELNNEISRQKDNLDRINHHLEEIIDERTKDLQVKNKKLSEYSSYLSHQIRGPIATLKGLMNLEREGLVDQQECIKMMDKCVSEIDEKIIEMSDMLHDPLKTEIGG